MLMDDVTWSPFARFLKWVSFTRIFEEGEPFAVGLESAEHGDTVVDGVGFFCSTAFGVFGVFSVFGGWSVT